MVIDEARQAINQSLEALIEGLSNKVEKQLDLEYELTYEGPLQAGHDTKWLVTLNANDRIVFTGYSSREEFCLTSDWVLEDLPLEDLYCIADWIQEFKSVNKEAFRQFLNTIAHIDTELFLESGLNYYDLGSGLKGSHEWCLVDSNGRTYEKYELDKAAFNLKNHRPIDFYIKVVQVMPGNEVVSRDKEPIIFWDKKLNTYCYTFLKNEQLEEYLRSLD